LVINYLYLLAKKLLNPPKFLGEAIVNIKEDEVAGTERDTINDISSDLEGCRGEGKSNKKLLCLIEYH
jgi:hypothetical protein